MGFRVDPWDLLRPIPIPLLDKEVDVQLLGAETSFFLFLALIWALRIDAVLECLEGWLTTLLLAPLMSTECLVVCLML